MRVLGVIRLSRETESTTSPARQKEIIERWAESQGHEIVGWAVDIDVSAAVDPWDRPQLGPWLRGQRKPFDVIAAWKLDRLSRRVMHFSKLLEFARSNDRSIVSVTEGFDLSTTMGRMFATIIATLAEGELETIRERTKGSYDHLTKHGRHRGGFVPYGYQPVRNPKGPGWVLEVDPTTATVVREIVDRVIGGESVNAVVVDLNTRNEPTALDIQRIRSGKDPKGSKWRVGNLSKMLRSELWLGYLVADDGKPIVDDAALRVRRADPIIDRATWRKLQTELDDRASNRKPRPRANAAQLLRIAMCGECEKPTPMYLYPGRTYRYYRCASKAIGGVACANGSVRKELLEKAVADYFLDKVGGMEIIRRVFVPGESHAAEIADAEAALGRLVERLELIPSGGPAERAIIARMTEHEKRLAELRALPETADRWVDEPTGHRFRDVWEADPTGRRNLLREAGVVAWVKRTPTRRGSAPDIRFEIGAFGDAETQRLREVELEELAA